MKSRNIILMASIVVLILGIGFYIRPQDLPKQTKAKTGHAEIWYCPMHPHYTSDHPGRCPICGMDLVKRIEAAQEQSNDIAGYTTISVTAQKQQLAGVQTMVVRKAKAFKTIQSTGEYIGQVYAQVFEGDLAYIKIGQKAFVDVPAYHQTYGGVVSSIDSSIDEASRSIRVRIWLVKVNQNKWKSNMFVNVRFPIGIGDGIFVPRDALMDTGVRKIVFVQKNEGTFEPREIQTGVETDNGFEVKSGLKEGERVVIGGNFLLDSESRVQAGLQADTTSGGSNNG